VDPGPDTEKSKKQLIFATRFFEKSKEKWSVPLSSRIFVQKSLKIRERSFLRPSKKSAMGHDYWKPRAPQSHRTPRHSTRILFLKRESYEDPGPDTEEIKQTIDFYYQIFWK